VKNVTHVGMDVHKRNIVVAKSQYAGQAEMVGEYPNTEKGVHQLRKALQTIQKESDVKLCYEAGPCGFALKRILDQYGYDCSVVAPSLIPVQVGNRIKNDTRDAKKLAKLFASHQLTFIHVCDEKQESVRNVVRCREDMMGNIRRTRQRVNHFLIRKGITYDDGSHWTKKHMAWLHQLQMKEEYDQETLGEYLYHLDQLLDSLARLDRKIADIAQSPEYKGKVDALCAFRGVNILTAMILISEVVDFSRFRNPKELMAYLGMVPSEYSSGATTRRGSITKTGNSRVRKALTETAHHYRHKPIVGDRMKKVMKELPSELCLPPMKAMHRLNKRYYAMLLRGKPKQKVVVAVGRELIGFIWHSMVLVEQWQAQTELKVA